MENKIIKNTAILHDIKSFIERSKQEIAVTVNVSLSMLYWQIGSRINEEILKNKRAEYGKQIVATLSLQLTNEYGKGWSKRQLHHCINFAEVFPDYRIVYTLCTQLSWSHIRLIIPLKAPLKRDFYIEMCKLENQIENAQNTHL